MEDFDLENPLTSSKSQEQDQTDTISELFASESDHMPSEAHFQSLKSQYSLVSLRRDATSSIVKARFSCNIDPSVTYLAMNYLNRFVSRRGMLSAKPWILKLLSVSCLSLASKMMKTALSLTDFQMEEGIIFDSQTIQRMELLILGVLKWRMRSITPFAFLHFFLCLFERNDPPLKQALKARATDLIFKAQNEIKFLKYKSSIVAASALLSASHELSPMQFPSFLKAISSCAYVNKEELLDCCNLMQDVVMGGYGSIVFDRASSSDKAVSALDCDFLTSESENTNNISSRSDIFIQTFFQGKEEVVNMVPVEVVINSTGMYYLYFMFCDPQLKGLTITGRTVWRNPDGYLPGKMAPLMTFYGFMSLAYLVLGLAWFLQFVRFWKDLLQLHYHITVVIALGMCEMAFWYFEYANFNSTGSRPMGITIWAVTFTAVKKTVSRLLLLVVSMGYGVVRPTLGGITSKVALLGVIYFVASEALELVEHLGNINDFSGKAKLFLVLPVAILDACFILWIFSSLSKTLEKLQMRRSMAKLELYRKFTNSLAVSVLLSVAWIGYELYFNASDPLSELWERAWIIPTFWNVLAYILLVVICLLWAPSQNPTRYAYSEETGEDFDEEGISLTASVAKTKGELVSKLERKERKTAGPADHVFGLVGENEEDKRE